MPLKTFRLSVDLPDNIVGLRVKTPSLSNDRPVSIVSWVGGEIVVKSYTSRFSVEYAVRDGGVIRWRAITPSKVEILCGGR